MAGLSAERALQIWQEKGLLSAKQAEDLRRGLASEAATSGTRRGIVIFSTIGAVLVGLGVILFIGSNWDRAGPVVRVALVFGGYGLVCAAAWGAGRRGLPRVGESLWFLATLVFGGAIFLLAQVFNFSLTFWQGPFLWLVGAVAMGYARQKGAYGVLAIPLAVLTLGWLGGGSGWFMDDQLEFLVSERGLAGLFGLLGVGFASLGLLARRFRNWTFASRSLIAWGGLMVAVTLVVSSAHDELAGEMFELLFTPKQIAIISGVLVLAAAAILFGETHRNARAMLIGITLLLLILIVPSGGKPLLGTLFDRNLALFALYVVFVFGLSVATVWVGVRAFNRHLINIGIASSSIIILIQYFSWSFDMLPTSFAFILGGIVLIVLSIVMERTRRAMIARVEAGD